MKIEMLMASGLCLALTLPVFAQDTQPQDSVYITPFTRCKIILVGDRITKLIKESNLEVLKNKFIEDYRESAKDKDFPAGAKRIIYLASQDGRRRLKAMPDESLPLSVKHEISAFNQGLPSFHYTIYDLTKNYEYHIYVNEPDDLNKLYELNSAELLVKASGQGMDNIRLVYRVDIVHIDTTFRINTWFFNDDRMLVLTPVFGVGLINSTLSPNFGFHADFQTQNRYANPNYKVGFGYAYNIMADYQNKTFSNFYKFHNLDIHFLKNISGKNKELWFGFSAGRYYTDKLFGTARNGTLDKAWKFGIINQFSSFGLEYNFIYEKKGNRNAAITLSYHL